MRLGVRAWFGAVSLLAVACGGGGDDLLQPLDTSTTSTTTTVVTTTTVPEVDPLLITSLEAARSGVVRIVTQGSLRTPEGGFATEVGTGSGFFVSSDGLVVTNAHVVNGASQIDVYPDGADAIPWSAKVLGVSECDDLALLQVQLSEPVAYFGWFEGVVDAGLDVYAAGFPLGEPEFTLTRGIVAKARADGDLAGTSSIPHTLEHDANLQPGSSGGPLITRAGEVVAVNYAGGARATTTAQFYAIAAELATGTVERLRSGDVASVGINAQPVYVDATGVAGIWVAGVAVGSPAERLGLRPGDVIMTMDSVEVGVAGNLSTYCRVLRGAAGRTVPLEVLRLDTSELLRGDLNGGTGLQLVFSFADDLGTDVADTDDRYERFLRLADSTGLLAADVPEVWDDIGADPMDGPDALPYPALVASTDRSAFPSTYRVPGVMFQAWPTDATTFDEWLDDLAPSVGDCRNGGRFDYDDSVFVGRYQVWSACRGTNAVRVILVTRPLGPGAAPSEEGWTVITTVQALTTADLDALDRIWASFDLLG
jgi:serine protease Do